MSHRPTSKAGVDDATIDETKTRILAEKFGDLANLAVAALVFGQAVGLDVFSVGAAGAGIAIWSVFTGFSLALKGDDR